MILRRKCNGAKPVTEATACQHFTLDSIATPCDDLVAVRPEQKSNPPRRWKAWDVAYTESVECGDEGRQIFAAKIVGPTHHESGSLKLSAGRGRGAF